MRLSPTGLTVKDITSQHYRSLFEELYRRFNRKEFIHPDPVEFVHRYEDPRDREVVGLVASSLAYGRVAQVIKSVSSVLAVMGNRPGRFLMETEPEALFTLFYGFKHRFTTDRELSLTLMGARAMIERHGSLNAAFLSGVDDDSGGVMPAVDRFAEGLNAFFQDEHNSLIPSHEKKSAKKRLNLFLRWMARSDEVDPGGWDGIPTASLVVPLDTHMFRIARMLGFTARKSADLSAVMEITAQFSEIEPGDPVKYDFSLTRFGIQSGLGIEDLLRHLGPLANAGRPSGAA
jgi:uncharacterized protein (TIGR02757 family)